MDCMRLMEAVFVTFVGVRMKGIDVGKEVAVVVAAAVGGPENCKCRLAAFWERTVSVCVKPEQYVSSSSCL